MPPFPFAGEGGVFASTNISVPFLSTHPWCPDSVDTMTIVQAAAADPVGVVEIAARLGVERQTVDKWRTRKILPAPTWTVGGRPAWSWPVVEGWAKESGRLLA